MAAVIGACVSLAGYSLAGGGYDENDGAGLVPAAKYQDQGLGVATVSPSMDAESRNAAAGRSGAALWVVSPMYVPAVVVGAVEGEDAGVGRGNVSHGGLPGVEQWRELVNQYAWNADEALSVMACESGGRADAYNDGNYGLMQINSVHQQKVRDGDLANLFDPAENLRVAALIYADQGWSPWACRP